MDELRLESIENKLDKLLDVVQGEKGICVRLSIQETKTQATETGLIEHKQNHWQFAALVLTGSGVLTAVIFGVIKVVAK